MAMQAEIQLVEQEIKLNSKEQPNTEYVLQCLRLLEGFAQSCPSWRKILLKILNVLYVAIFKNINDKNGVDIPYFVLDRRNTTEIDFLKE